MAEFLAVAISSGISCARASETQNGAASVNTVVSVNAVMRKRRDMRHLRVRCGMLITGSLPDSIIHIANAGKVKQGSGKICVYPPRVRGGLRLPICNLNFNRKSQIANHFL